MRKYKAGDQVARVLGRIPMPPVPECLLHDHG